MQLFSIIRIKENGERHYDTHYGSSQDTSESIRQQRLVLARRVREGKIKSVDYENVADVLVAKM